MPHPQVVQIAEQMHPAAPVLARIDVVAAVEITHSVPVKLVRQAVSVRYFLLATRQLLLQLVNALDGFFKRG